ncbi:MAG: hypothetical protein ACLTYW_00880 [Collinsella sp.]
MVRAFAGGVRSFRDQRLLYWAVGRGSGLFQAAGIQSPGVASAPAIAERMEQVLRDAGVALRERDDWDPIRRAPDDLTVRRSRARKS